MELLDKFCGKDGGILALVWLTSVDSSTVVGKLWLISGDTVKFCSVSV